VPTLTAHLSRRRIIATCALAGALSCAAPTALFAAGTDTEVDTQDDTEITDDTVYYYDLEKDPSECVGFLPKPGCGKEPEDAGERGGALQYTVFAVMLGGIGVIATVIGRNVIRRDRIANAPRNDVSTPQSGANPPTDSKNASDN
jgi:hypothetical protein